MIESKMTRPGSEPEKFKLFRTPAFRNLEFLTVSHQTHVYPRHWNETYVIQAVEQGVNGCYCKQATHLAPAGSVVLINPFEIHTGYAVGEAPLMYRTLYPTPELLAEITATMVERKVDLPFFPGTVVWDDRLAQMILRAHRACEEGADSLTVESLTLAALTFLIRHHADQRFAVRPYKKELAAVKRAKEYLAENFTQNISLDTLSKIAYLSPFHLLRAFRQTVGLPPHEYLINLRVEHAKQLLAKGRPLAEVAYETGFCDQSHFNRQSKRLIGITPGHYLKKSNFVQNIQACR